MRMCSSFSSSSSLVCSFLKALKSTFLLLLIVVSRLFFFLHVEVAADLLLLCRSRVPMIRGDRVVACGGGKWRGFLLFWGNFKVEF
jgi:hypothetical protein